MLRMTFCALFLMTSSAFAQTRSLTLDESFQLATQKNQSVAIQESTVVRARETKAQARGAVFPSLAAIGDYTRQDIKNLPATSTIKEDSTSARLHLNQSLFRGFSEYAAMRSASSLVEQEEFNLKDSKNNLYVTVARSFYQLLIYKSEDEKLKKLLELTDRRVGELRKRTSVGRTRRGDLLTAQSQAASLKSQIAANTTLLQQSQAQFEALTNVSSPSLVDNLSLPEQMPPLTQYISKIEDRPDIASSAIQAKRADENVAISKGGHWPRLDLSGNYYLKRTGSLEDVKWDAGLTLTVPLFEGGITQSQVREASQLYYESQKTLELNRESASVELKQLHSTAAQGLEQIKSLKEAVELAEANYREQSKDYRYGLTTNLEVFQSLNSYVDLERNLDKTIYQTKIAIVQLKAASGVVQ
ncbi:MAG: TolC family protein [Bdellovibrionales bacterium]